MSTYAVIVAAAGKSQRFGGKDKKPYAKLDGRPIFLRTLELFVNRDDVAQVILAVDPEDEDMIKNQFGPNLGFMGVRLATGGATRALTVKSALAGVRDDVPFIAVHDAVRVCVTANMIDRVFTAAAEHGAAILAAPVTGTLKRVDDAKHVAGDAARVGLYEAQTPQVFKREILVSAYETVDETDPATDDAGVVSAAGHPVRIVESDSSNLKITFPGDIALAAAILKSRPKVRPSSPRGPFEEAQW